MKAALARSGTVSKERASAAFMPSDGTRFAGRPSNGFALCVLCVSVVCGAAPRAQQLLDRVLARVNTSVITQSDLRAAIGLGLVEPGSGPDAERASLEQLVQRQVLLAEVARFPAPAPAEAAIDDLATAMKARSGAALDGLVRSTGIDEARIRELARDTLRIEGYLRQRFGAASTLNDPGVRQWMRDVGARTTVVMPRGDTLKVASDK